MDKDINNKINIKDFLLKYDNSEDKKGAINQVIINDYVPYLIKKTTLLPVVNNSIVTMEDKIPYIDMSLVKVNHLITLLLLYTRLDIEGYLQEEKHSPFELYDEFQKRALWSDIKSVIELPEITEINSILDDMIQNWNSQNKGVEIALYNIYSDIIQAILNGVDNYISKDDFLEDMKNNILS